MQRLRVRSTAIALLILTGLVVATGRASAADIIRYGIDDEHNISRLPQVVSER
jgi:hypothetical protein